MRFWGKSSKAIVVLSIASAGIAAVVNGQSQPVTKSPATHRANELTLAGLRPGVDSSARAMALYKRPDLKNEKDGSQLKWSATCRKETLAIDLDNKKKVQVIRVTEADRLIGDCVEGPPGPWKTGKGLRVWDGAKRVTALYGEPDSRSPSSKDGQSLELLYYAFDWAGADVPQVMEVLCTKEKDGQPGRVIEITLAAPSL
jgi:hypothetical protein